MHFSPAHTAAVMAAIRLPALNARLALLASADASRSRIEFYDSTYPDPPGSTAPAPLVALSLTAAAGGVDADTYQIVLDTPMEAQVTGADPGAGSVPLWARIYTPAGDWWADLSVSVEGGGGEIQLVKTAVEGGVDVVRWYNGAFVRLQSASVQG